jgi:hypothetical protein
LLYENKTEAIEQSTFASIPSRTSEEKKNLDKIQILSVKHSPPNKSQHEGVDKLWG